MEKSYARHPTGNIVHHKKYENDTCNASSLVGERMSARKFFPGVALLVGAKSLSRMGSTKHAVLPEPVRAIATTSLPSRARGMVWKN